MTRQPAIERYRHQLATTESSLHRHHQTLSRLVVTRMVLFLVAGYLLLTSYFSDIRSWSWIAVGLGAMLAFLVSAAIHEWIQQTVQRELIQRRLYRRLIARISRDWEELSKKASMDVGIESIATADDLDLVGDRSLFSWCSLAGTQTGSRAMVQQLTSYAEASTIHDRQQAVRELAPQFEIRERLMMQLWQLGAAQASLEDFSDWAKNPSTGFRWLNFLTWFGPACLLSGILAIISSVSLDLPTPVLWSSLILLTVGVLTNVLLVLGFVGFLHNAFKRITTHQELEATCQELLRSLNQLHPQSTLLNEFRSSLCDPSQKNSAIAALAKLRWPMMLAGLRLHPSLYLVFLIFQICLLWDFRVYEWIERWRVQYATEVPRWIASLGQLEAILAASAIHDEYPSWAFPEFDPPEVGIFEATQMGHPLLGDQSRVNNDLKIDADRPVVLVTGSNMSGKSTLMRAVGVNVALSRIGAPVCAEKFRCPTMDIATSIRVRDSLADGVSFFMAELNRLREVVDAVQQSREKYNRPSLVILDEILQGTNSQERQIAVSHVVQTLLRFDAMLLVSTHDLQLADTEGFSNNSQVVHFREHFEDRDGKSKMLFDYRMHPGIAPTTNALKLLELVGLGKNLSKPENARKA